MRSARLASVLILLVASLTTGPGQVASQPPAFDVVIRGGTVYDGTGAPGQARGCRHPR